MNNILKLLHALQKIDPEFPLHYAVCLTEIAMDEGLSLTTLAMRVNLSLSTVSRIVGALANNRQKGTPYGLVKLKIAVTERRRKEIYLTARGRAVIDGIVATLPRAA